MGIFVKLINNEINPAAIVFYRSITGFVFIIPLIWKIRLSEIKMPFFLILRGITGSLALLLYYMAINTIKLSDAAMLCYTHPLFSTLFAIMFLREKWDKWTVISLSFALSGIALILKPGFEAFKLGHLYGLLSGILGGVSVCLVKHLKASEKSSTIVVSYLMFCAALTIYSPLLGGNNYSYRNILFLVIIGASGSFAQLLMTNAYKHLKAATGSVIMLFTIFNIYIIAILVLNEKIDYVKIAGGLVLIAGCSFALIHKPNKIKA
jgi:drug/metabolite transporter (DMT)-like permease